MKNGRKEVEILKKIIVELQVAVQVHLETNKEGIQNSMTRKGLQNFIEEDYVLVAQDNFLQSEKLLLRWRRPRRLKKFLWNYIYKEGFF